MEAAEPPHKRARREGLSQKEGNGAESTIAVSSVGETTNTSASKAGMQILNKRGRGISLEDFSKQIGSRKGGGLQLEFITPPADDISSGSEVGVVHFPLKEQNGVVEGGSADPQPLQTS